MRLRARLVGKTVVSVDQSPLTESYYHIATSDGESFHICGTELGSWIVDGPRADGTYPGIGALAQAIGDYRYGKNMYEDPPVEVVVIDGLLVFDAGDGELFQVRPSGIVDPWERLILSHPKAASFMGMVVVSGMTWKSWFNKDHVDDLEDPDRVPRELLLPFSEL